MKRIYELIKNTNFEEVNKAFEYFYGNEYTQRIKKVYEDLKKAIPNPNETNMIVFIRAMMEGDEEDYVVEEFDSKDTSLWFDVCGQDTQSDFLYGLGGVEYDDFVGYHINDETLEKFSELDIIAHLIWELDW